MASTSSAELTRQLLSSCLSARPFSRHAWQDLLTRALSDDAEEALLASRHLFAGLVEPLCDRFEPRLSELYVELFSEVIALVNPAWPAASLRERYRRILASRPIAFEPRRVLVLSRVTLGADIAVTSVVLQGIKSRFPSAAIFLAGPRKNWELFAADARIQHWPLQYERAGSLRSRLQTPLAISDPYTLVVDPDSRLTQLGLYPVCPEAQYLFFESRSWGGSGRETLGELTASWVEHTLGVRGLRTYMATEASDAAPGIAVSLGVGENESKRISGRFESSLLRDLANTGLPLLVDQGAGGEERERVQSAVSGNSAVHVWDGSFSGFASRIARSRLFVGYDSAGGHAAAAAGIPLISIFAGYPNQRMADRWRPSAHGPIDLIQVQPDDGPEQILQRVRTSPVLAQIAAVP